MAYQTMVEQAGNRLIIRYKYVYAGTNTAGLNESEYGSVMTSHFADIEELMRQTKAMNRIVIWYEVNKGQRVTV